MLPEYGSDPRVVGNLVDGVNRTCDDTHMWLAPFTAGRAHLVLLDFDRDYSIALLRIWVPVCHCHESLHRHTSTSTLQYTSY